MPENRIEPPFLCRNPNCPFTEPHWHFWDHDPDNPGNIITTTHWVSRPYRGRAPKPAGFWKKGSGR